MTSKRAKSKFKGLDKSVNLKVRKELIDFDYLDQLTDKEKTWLSNFMQEWAGGDFNHSGPKMHRSTKSKKMVYDANNARNRDAFTITKANGMLKGLKREDVGRDDMLVSKAQIKQVGLSGSKSTVPNELEDTLITVLDHFNARKKRN